MKKNIKKATRTRKHRKILPGIGLVVLLAGIGYVVKPYMTEAVKITYPTDQELTQIVENSPWFKSYEKILNAKEGDLGENGDYIDRSFGRYSEQYLKDHPEESSIVKNPVEKKMYCGDTTMYSISGESPSKYVGKLRDGTYWNFWSGYWFHSFVHYLTMPSDNADSKKMLFPPVPGWRLDGIWDNSGIIHQDKVQATQNSFQITRIDSDCNGKTNCPIYTKVYDLEAETPGQSGISSELQKRLHIDVEWLNQVKHLALTRKALVVGQGLGADVAYQVSKQFKGSPDIKFIFVDPYTIPRETPNVIRWNKPSLDFADFRINKNLFSGKITSSARAKAQALELYNAIKKVVDENAAQRDPRCDDYEQLSNVHIAYEFIDRALKGKEPLVTLPILEAHNELTMWPKGQLAMYAPKVSKENIRFTADGSNVTVTDSTVYEGTTAAAIDGYIDDLFLRSTTGGGRSTDGRLHFTSYGSVGDKTPDSNTRQQRGNNDNLLVLGSVALSPNLITKYQPAHGAEVLVNDVHVGYYDDSSANSYKGTAIVNTIDIYDPANKYNDALFRIIPAGKWTISFGPVRPQTPNKPGQKKDPAKEKPKSETPKDKGTGGSREPELPPKITEGVKYPENTLLPPLNSSGGSASNGSTQGGTTGAKNSGVGTSPVGKFLNTKTVGDETVAAQQDVKANVKVNAPETPKATTSPSIMSQLVAPFKTLWNILFSK